MTIQRLRRAVRLLPVLVFLMAGLAGAADPSPEVAPVRQPTLRRIHSERDAAALERIELHRAKLPLPYCERNNFAWAMVWTKDLDKTEYYAHSGLQNLKALSRAEARKLDDISLRPEAGRYHVLCVNQHDVVDGANCWRRDVDTEYKIIEDIVARLPDVTARGRIKLYTDLPPCASCWNVLKQFMAEYPGMRVQVLYR